MSLILGILLQDSLITVIWIVFSISVIGLGFIFIHQFILPILRMKALELPDPISVGDSFDLVVNEIERIAHFAIGKKIGNIQTLTKAITEDHLVFHFKKARDTEDYDISIQKNGLVLYKPPRMDTYSKMESKEILESNEIIGHSAEFRLSDRVVKERMVNFVEISMIGSFFFNKSGNERMKFTFTITKIQPGLNRAKRNREGTFDWGQEEGSEEEDSSEED
jgi:hypothetical protein